MVAKPAIASPARTQFTHPPALVEPPLSSYIPILMFVPLNKSTHLWLWFSYLLDISSEAKTVCAHFDRAARLHFDGWPLCPPLFSEPQLFLSMQIKLLLGLFSENQGV